MHIYAEHTHVARPNFERILTTFLIFTIFGLMSTPVDAADGKMPLNPKAKSIDTNSEGIGILVFHLVSEIKEKIVPRIGVVHIYTQEGEKVSKFYTKSPSGIRRAKGDMLSPFQVISVQLPAGRYSIRNVRGYGMYTKGINRGYAQGKWGFDLNYPLEIEVGTVVYLGRINGSIVKKEKSDGDSVGRASVPLLDVAIRNAIAGFSGAVLDFEVTAAYEEDMNLIKERYPWLDTNAIEDVSTK